MDSVVQCPSCKHKNAPVTPVTSCCSNYRTHLARGMRVTGEEAGDLDIKRHADARRRSIIRWALFALFLLSLGVWTTYKTLGSYDPPVSNISANAIHGDWPMFQRDPSHSAYVTNPIPITNGHVKWRFETDAPIRSSPAVVQGTVYLGTGDRRVIALEAETGKLIWEREMTGPIDSSPAVAGDLVFISLRDGRLLALGSADGKTHWEFPANYLIYSSPSVYQGVVYFGSGDGSLYALDAVTGKKRWSYSTGGRFISAPAVHENVVAMTSDGKRIYILDANTGNRRLDIVTSHRSNMGGAPSLDKELAYVANTHGDLTAVDWRKREGPFEKTANFIWIQLFVLGMVDSLPSPKGLVWGFQRSSESFIGSPAVDANMVYIAAESGAVYALNRSDGRLLWKFTSNYGITGSPSIAGQTLYVGDAEGGLHGIDTLTGEVRWRFNVNDQVSSTVVLANGMLYVATVGGTLYAIQ